MRRTLIVLSVAALVTAAAPAYAGGGGCHEEQHSEAAGTSVSLKDFCFAPTVVHVKAGQTVTWTNVDDAPHSITGMPGTFDTPEDLLQGDKFTWIFHEAGTYPYYCVIHRRMAGAVIVGGGASGTSLMDTGSTGRVTSAGTDTSPVAAKGRDSSAALPIIALAIAIPIAGGFGFGLGRKRDPILPN